MYKSSSPFLLFQPKVVRLDSNLVKQHYFWHVRIATMRTNKPTKTSYGEGKRTTQHFLSLYIYSQLLYIQTNVPLLRLIGVVLKQKSTLTRAFSIIILEHSHACHSNDVHHFGITITTRTRWKLWFSRFHTFGTKRIHANENKRVLFGEHCNGNGTKGKEGEKRWATPLYVTLL